MADYDKWIDNVGEIFLSDTDCFWMFPRHMFLKKRLCITSPWFSHESETWRLVKTSNEIDNEYLCLFLWKKICSKPANLEYTFKSYIKSYHHVDQKIIATCTGNVNSEFGYACYHFFYLLNKDKTNLVSFHGLVKLFFEIKKKDNILDSFPSIRKRCFRQIGKNRARLGAHNTSVLKNASQELSYLHKHNCTATIVKSDDAESCGEPEKTEEPELKGVDKLVQNLKNLMLDEQSSDVVFKVEDREIKAHKNILKVRSPVFASMFQTHTKENITGIVNIPDCTAAAFEFFLPYIYTGLAEVISLDNVCDLYYVADKYLMNDLKSECVVFMEKNLSVESFCEIMKLCFRHDELHLQKIATQFFCDNLKKVIKTAQWECFLKDFTTQANELFIKSIDA